MKKLVLLSALVALFLYSCDKDSEEFIETSPIKTEYSPVVAKTLIPDFYNEEGTKIKFINAENETLEFTIYQVHQVQSQLLADGQEIKVTTLNYNLEGLESSVFLAVLGFAGVPLYTDPSEFSPESLSIVNRHPTLGNSPLSFLNIILEDNYFQEDSGLEIHNEITLLGRDYQDVVESKVNYVENGTNKIYYSAHEGIVAFHDVYNELWVKVKE